MRRSDRSHFAIGSTELDCLVLRGEHHRRLGLMIAHDHQVGHTSCGLLGGVKRALGLHQVGFSAGVVLGAQSGLSGAATLVAQGLKLFIHL